MKPATPAQIKAINATLAVKGLMEDKASIIEGFTSGRTTHSSEIYFDEAKKLLSELIGVKRKAPNKMLNKIFAMAHEMGWINNKMMIAVGGVMIEKKDYTPLHNWIKKYGYLHKGLNEYKYNEIPKLVTQFQEGPYKSYLSKSHEV